MEQSSGRRRNFLKLNTHFVWGTKDRLPLIGPEHERRLYRFIETVIQKYEGAVLAIGGMPDHIHVLASLSPKFGISEVIKNVKGSSSRFFSEEVAAGAWFQWQPNYGAINVSPEHVEAVKQYILNQKRHHAEGAPWTEYERTDEPDD